MIYRYAHDVHSCKRTHDISDYSIPLQVKMGQPRPLFIYFRLFKHTLHFLQQINVEHVHPVYGAGIQTHNLWNMSLLPLPQDQQGFCTNHFDLLYLISVQARIDGILYWPEFQLAIIGVKCHFIQIDLWAIL